MSRWTWAGTQGERERCYFEVGRQYGCCVDLNGLLQGARADIVTSSSSRGNLGITAGSTSTLILKVMMMVVDYRQSASDS